MTCRDDDDDDNNNNLPRVFATTRNAAPCHLNDVPMTSLELKLPRGAGGDPSSGKAKARAIVGALLVVQHDLTEAGRENAIRWYL